VNAAKHPTPDWDLDVEYGEDGERDVAEWVAGLVGSHEVKRKSREDLFFYIELEHNPFGRGWEPSGISTSVAKYVDVVINDTGIILAVPRERLLELIDLHLGRAVEETDGDCPTRGLLVSLADVIQGPAEARRWLALTFGGRR
jgi:hypothetical protein